MSSEAWLIRKAKKGDTKAYGELIQLHKDYFYRNAFCYVKNVDLAGDVFHQRSEKSELFPHMDDTHYL